MGAGVRILALHDISDLGDMPTDVDVVVCGHSHVPGIQYHGRVLVVNPGSATQPRLVPAPTVAILEIDDEARVSARIVRLDELGGS
jgi:putative phosphoesterase